MKLGVIIGTLDDNPQPQIDLAVEADRLGYDSCWFGEIYGSDCFTPLAWIGARTQRIKLGTSIMQISARTPANAAMTAVTLDRLSQGRMLLGIGVSGPQVVEGWYGQPFPKPLARTREWIDIFRRIVARDAPLEFHGEHYDLPLRGGAGLGKPLKLISHPLRPRIPIYLGAEGPKNVALATELCDGWLPMFIAPGRLGVYDTALRARRPDFDIAATVTVSMHDDLQVALASIKRIIGFYVGGMGAREANLHKNHIARLGFPDAAQQIQDLFLAGKRDAAYAAVPDALADEVSLCGPKARIRERLQDWKRSAISSLIVQGRNLDTLRFLAEELL